MSEDKNAVIQQQIEDILGWADRYSNAICIIDDLRQQLAEAQRQRDGYRWDYEALGEEGYDEIIDHVTELNKLLEKNLELLNKEPPHHERKLKEARQYARKYYRQWRDGLVDVAQQRHILKNYVRVATEELTDTEAELKEAQGRYDKLYQQFKGQEERIRELTAGALQKK